MSGKTGMPTAWADLRIAVVGGDEREQEIARLAATNGAEVVAFGFPWPDSGIIGVARADSAAAAFHNAHIALLPIPGIAEDGSIFATERIVPGTDLLATMEKGGHIILGKADPRLQGAASATGIHLHEYESDTELMFLRAPAIVEGALKIVIENTPFTIHRSSACVVGYGHIGSVLARTLTGLGAYVTVAARNPAQRAEAVAANAQAISLEVLPQRAPDFDLLFSTVPARVVGNAIIDRLKPGAVLIDLSAPPGSMDLDHARRSGRRAIWARALGRRAPLTVGASQWSGISKIIDRILKGGG
jgi:dipicolinate synthase subunit A